MDRLSYLTLEKQGYTGYLLREAPERVLQFGEGNFLRAFAEDFIDRMNEKAGFNAKVVLVQPRGGHPETSACFREQDGLYTLWLRGRENGAAVERRRVVSAVSRCLDAKNEWAEVLGCAKNPALRFLITNTTEAGIVFDPACGSSDAPPSSFPAKLARFLYARWKAALPGFIILSCELIDHNGDALARCVKAYIDLWGLEPEFAAWTERENLFCTTLVDRIVTGAPKTQRDRIYADLGYEDRLLDTGEVFADWVIEGPPSIGDELPFEKAGLPIRVVGDVTPYKQRKVRILNGAHTSMVPAAYLTGRNIVRECMSDPVIKPYLDTLLFREIIPTLDLPRDELEAFAFSVLDRFDNPYIDHQLLDIALNSAAKWKARVMPSLIEYYRRFGALPKCLCFSLAAFIAFYADGERGGEAYPVRDDPPVLAFFAANKGKSAAALARAVINEPFLWDGELEKIPGLADAVAAMLARIGEVGIREAMKECAQ